MRGWAYPVFMIALLAGAFLMAIFWPMTVLVVAALVSLLGGSLPAQWAMVRQVAVWSAIMSAAFLLVTQAQTMIEVIRP